MIINSKKQRYTTLTKIILSYTFTLLSAVIIAAPVHSAVVISNFDVDTDGWSWSGGTPDAFTWESSGGNPDGYIRFDNNKPPIDDALLYAPAKFLGNWKDLGYNNIRYDVKIFDTGGYTNSHPYRINIYGPGGSATWFGPDPDPLAGWLRLTAPIEESQWRMRTGTWDALISNVTTLNISTAFYTNTGTFEITGIDNVILYNIWDQFYDMIFDDTSGLSLLRQYRDKHLGKTFIGRHYTKLLYSNSEDALQVLLDNPELIYQAKELIYANLVAVDDILHGQEGAVYNTEEIAAFLDAYAKVAPPTLKSLSKMVKRHMLKMQKKGELFFGFRLK